VEHRLADVHEAVFKPVTVWAEQREVPYFRVSRPETDRIDVVNIKQRAGANSSPRDGRYRIEAACVTVQGAGRLSATDQGVC